MAVFAESLSSSKLAACDSKEESLLVASLIFFGEWILWKGWKSRFGCLFYFWAY